METNRQQNKKLFITIVENDTLIQAMLMKILNLMTIEHFEINIKAFEDGIQFFESKTLEQQGEHLVILDGIMPVMDGIEILQKVKSDKGKRVYVLMLSGRKSPAEIDKAIKLGADDYVTKPFSIKDLQTRVQQIIQRMKQ